jgi:hypothetical protein
MKTGISVCVPYSQGGNLGIIPHVLGTVPLLWCVFGTILFTKIWGPFFWGQ